MTTSTTFGTRTISLAATALAALLVILAPRSLPAAVWTLDGFNIRDGGTVAITGNVRAVVQQHLDGKIVIGGDFALTGGSPSVTLKNIARLNPDGTLDTSFVPPEPDGAVNALALQPDSDNPDLVIIGGSFSSVGGSDRKGVARLSGVDGSLDGFAPVTTGATVAVNALELFPDGTSLLVGGSFPELKVGVPTKNLVGISLSGTGDLTWTYSGGLSGDAGNVAVWALRIADGAVLVGGEFTTPWSVNIARFSSLGGYDESFRPPSPGGGVRAVAVQADGKILLGGEFSGGLLARNYLARLNADGTRDDFDAGFDVASGSQVSAVVVQPDGKILAAGCFGVGPPLDKRRNLVRLNIDAGLSEVSFPHADAAIRALTRQADGKLLAGGEFGNVGTVPRTCLARFYPYGALDDDIPQVTDDGGEVVRTSVSPDGDVTIAGLFQSVMGGTPRFHIARLQGDWTIDPAFSSSLKVGQRVLSFAPFPDGRLLMAGNFTTINGLTQRRLVQIDAGGVPGPAAFNTTVDGYMNWSITSMSAVVFPADGTLPEDGMVYVGGDTGVVSPYRYLARLKNTGARDTGFTPPAGVNGAVTSLAVQPDNNLLVTTVTGRVLRLRTDGTPDPAWHGGTPLQLGGRVNHVVVLPDGHILVSGYCMWPGSVVDAETHETVSLSRNLLRLNSDGTVDESFVIQALYTYDGTFTDNVVSFALQTDGSIIIYGVFDEIRDGFGSVIKREYAARITPEGRLDPGFDLGPFSFASGTPIDQINTINLQPDGKFLVGGDFVDKKGMSELTRYANGWSAEDLSVSGTGDTFTWLRSGSSPELWRASFEYLDERDPVNPRWVTLGPGHRIAGGWQLQVPDPAALHVGAERNGVNHYVRARGWVAGEPGSAGSLVESTRLYYLKPLKTTVTVTAYPQEKSYGRPDPELTYGFSPALAAGDRFSGSLSRVAGENVGSYAITRGTLALGPSYDLAFNGASLAIGRAPLSIRAEDRTKTAGFPNPALTAVFSGLAPWDTPASLGGSPELTTAVDAYTPKGTYPIHAALGGITSANYEYSFPDGTFIVTGRAQSIDLSPLPVKTYGDAGFAAGGRATSLLPLSYGSSNPAVATVVDGEIRIGAAGSAVITATQGGDGFWDPAPAVSVLCTVKKAPLLVVAEDKSRAYLTPNPELTVLYRGFVNGEGTNVLAGAPSLATSATLASAAGGYPILAGIGSLNAANYAPMPVNGTLTVYRSCQEITFPPLPERTFGDPPFEIVASACSGLPLVFRSSDPGVARIDGNMITITGAGSAVITALQAGTDNMESAPQKSQTFVVLKSGQQVIFSSPAQKVVGDTPFALQAAASSGLTVGYLSSDPAVAAVEGSTVTVVGAGTTVITALQEGDGNYLAAPPVSRTLTVASEGNPPELDISTLTSGAVTANPVLNLMGSASDPSGIASLTVQGNDRTVDAALFSSAVVLAEGENSVSVAARDGAGNLAVHTYSVTLDPLAPSLSVSDPADNSVTDLASFALSGTVSPGSSVSVTVNGGAPVTLPVGGGAFSGGGGLVEGGNTVEVTAELSGRSSRVKRSVTFAPGKPALAVAVPEQDARTEAESVLVSIRSAASVYGSVVLRLGGVAYTPEPAAGLFRQQVPLALGENRITVEATAADGTVSVAQRNLVRVERIPGDLDGNGSVDILDAARLLRISLGQEVVTPDALAHGDLAPLVNGTPQPDGIIDVGDLLVLLRKIVGLVRF